MDSYIADARKAKGFLTPEELVRLVGKRSVMLDPYSLLVSRGVAIGKDNVFYPNVIIERTGPGTLEIGDGNVFYPGTYILSSAGAVKIGNGNQFGTGGCIIKANMSDAAIVIGDGGRYCDGANIMGKTNLGSGSQVLGNITVQSCTLAAGGTFQAPNPDERAAVLKGFGLARGVGLQKGQVRSGAGNFADRPVEWQRDYHPKQDRSITT